VSDQEQAQFAQRLDEALALQSRMPDWTPAFDDGLVQRLTHCTVCHGQPPTTWGILALWAASQAYVLCQRCATGEGMRQVERLFVRRYLATLGHAS
jgi:hypothetical protein